MWSYFICFFHSCYVRQVQVVRARFSALSYGIVSYLCKTTHPNNNAYVSPSDDELKVGSKKTKRIIWEKEVNIRYIILFTHVFILLYPDYDI